MVYCLINDGIFHRDIMKINYSLIDDSEEFRISKDFEIDLSKNNIVYFKFSPFQFKENRVHNFIEEISNDFIRSKYILGKDDFENYFLRIDEFNDIKNIFKCKYLKLNQALKRFNYLKYSLF